jgi:hypothetical protein
LILKTFTDAISSAVDTRPDSDLYHDANASLYLLINCKRLSRFCLFLTWFLRNHVKRYWYEVQ